MTGLEILGLVVFLVLGLAGLGGTVIPFLPDLPLIWLGALLYAVLTGFSEVSLGLLFTLAAIAAAGYLFDLLGQLYGAKKMGASRAGMVGALLGFFLGFSTMGVLGAIVGPFLGAMAGELLVGRSQREATRAGFGALLGFLASSLAKFVLGLVMIGVFLSRVF